MHSTKSKEHSISQWVSDIKVGNEDWFDELYKDNRDVFLGWVERNHRLSTEDAMDIYQNAMIALYENVKHNRITHLESSVSTYIIGIAKNLIYKHHRKAELINRHEVRLNEHYHFMALSVNELEKGSSKVVLALSAMREPCKSLLQLFYVQGLKLAAISEKLKYASVNVAKTQKSRCLKKLKEIVK